MEDFLLIILLIVMFVRWLVLSRRLTIIEGTLHQLTTSYRGKLNSLAECVGRCSPVFARQNREEKTLFIVLWRHALIVGLALLALTIMFLLPPIPQDPHYHAFADQRTLWGVPNFWNTASNLPFLLVALWGLRVLRSPAVFLQKSERAAYCLLLTGLGLVAFGSSYYHMWPDNDTLFWDRLPMTIVFMSLLAITIGERISITGGRLLLFPLIAIGVASVLYWRFSGDLRFYGAVQFYPMIALPIMLILFSPRYSGTAGIFAMIGLYAFAKVLELFDHQITSISATGGHPWKHVVGALAMLCYLNAVAHRRPLTMQG